MEKIMLYSSIAANAGIDLVSPVKRVLDSHWYVLGDEVTHFENEFAGYINIKNCVTVANGTDALELGLRALDIKTGDKVIVAANAGFYGSTAIHLIGASPWYIDIDPVTLTLSVDILQQVLVTDPPKAIIVTHLYGQLANIESIVDLATRSGVPVIEDCAQSHGAISNGRRAGSFGTLGCFSFYPTKNLGALGDGGAIVTNDNSIAARLRQLRQYGWTNKYRVEVPGGRNSRLDEMQAAILREKLPHLDRQNAERRAVARKYNLAFDVLPLRCPASLDEDYVAHLYVVRLANRERFRAFLNKHGIMTDIHYPIPDYQQTAYVCEQMNGSLPLTETACNTVVSLPCFPGMTDKEVDRVIQAVILYFKKFEA